MQSKREHLLRHYHHQPDDQSSRHSHHHLRREIKGFLSTSKEIHQNKMTMWEIIRQAVLMVDKIINRLLITGKEENANCAKNHIRILFFARNYRYIFLSVEMLNLFLLHYANYACTLGLRTGLIADTHLTIYGKDLTVQRIRHITCFVICAPNMVRVIPGGKSTITHN